MKKIIALAFLVSTFAVPVSAEFESNSAGYLCYAKDYESLWFQGWSSESVESARESAMQACRQGSAAPETCQVRNCGTAH